MSTDNTRRTFRLDEKVLEDLLHFSETTNVDLSKSINAILASFFAQRNKNEADKQHYIKLVLQNLLKRIMTDSFKVIIAGSRSFNDMDTLINVCDGFLSNYKNVVVVSGAAKGADQLGEKYATAKGFPVVHFLPDWDKYGKQAGYFRNLQMAEYGDALIAFWDSHSKGTKIMIQLANKNGLPVKVYQFNSLPSLF